MPSEAAVVTSAAGRTQHPPSSHDPVDQGDDQGATDEVITYGDEGEGEGEGEMELGGLVVGAGGVNINSDLMADIKNSLLSETIANSASSSDLDNTSSNGLDLKSLRLGGFDAATLSGLNSLAAAVNGSAGGVHPHHGALSMGGLHPFHPYGSLPPPLLSYPHLAASKLYSPFSGIPGLQIPPPPGSGLDVKGASLSGGVSHSGSGTGVGVSGNPSVSSPLLTSVSSSATYNTAAVSAALSNWAAAVSPQNARLPLAPPPGLSPNSLANLNTLHGAGGPNGTSSSSPLAMFAAHMFNGRHPSATNGAAASSNPYHQLLAAVSAGDLSRSNPAFPRGGPAGAFGNVDSASGMLTHPGDGGSNGGHLHRGASNGVAQNNHNGGSQEHMDQNHHPNHGMKEKPPKPAKPYVKKPLNAFMLFMKENREKVMQESTLKESAAINQILGRKWHQLEKTEQNRYYEMAKNERQAHQRLHPAWSARDNYATSKHRKRRKRSLTGFPDGQNPEGHPDGSGGFSMRDLAMGDPGRLSSGFLGMENLAGLTADEQADVFMQGRHLPPPHHPSHGMIPGMVPSHAPQQNARVVPGNPGLQGPVMNQENQQGDGGMAGANVSGAKMMTAHSVKSMVSSSNSNDTTASSNGSDNVDHTPESASKKCRARFGLEQQESWCKHCRRKKKCSVFTGNDDPAPASNTSGNSSTSSITPPNKDKSRPPSDGLVTPKNIKFPVDPRTTRTSSEDESPGFNTDSMASIKNELVGSLMEARSAHALTINDYPAPSKKPRSELTPNITVSNVSSMNRMNEKGTSEKFKVKFEANESEDSNSDLERENNVSDNTVKSFSGKDVPQTSIFSSLASVFGNPPGLIPASGIRSGNNCSLVSAASKLPLSLQGQIMSHLNNNHINSSSFTSQLDDKISPTNDLAGVRAPVSVATAAAFLTNGIKPIGSSVSPFDLTSNVPLQSPTGATKDLNALSPLLDLHHATVNNNISSLGAIKRSPKMQSMTDVSNNNRTSAWTPISLPMTSAELAASITSSIAASANSVSTTSTSLKSTAGHIPFAFSPFNPGALTSVSNSTTPNSPFSPLQPSLAAAAAGSLFSAGSLFAAASNAANAVSSASGAPSIPFSPFFNPAGFPGASFPGFKDPKDAMVSMALSNTSPAAASQS
ncbi:uncharacterized protein LOC134851860 isoform X3 [Symsagittifera roscoffensis]|uniref:uncharacterized protein LOC134851860 isoform X3 n=1 Tax=Symsagittifera roscoffensis TaxID=84072 RepID=UPI00307B79B0